MINSMMSVNSVLLQMGRNGGAVLSLCSKESILSFCRITYRASPCKESFGVNEKHQASPFAVGIDTEEGRQLDYAIKETTINSK